VVDRITLAGLLKIELPGHTAYLNDGGTVTFGGDVYSGSDDLLGVIADVDTLREGVDEAAPAFSVTFLTPSEDDVDSADLNDPAFQGARVRAWIVEVDDDTGLVTGDGDLIVDAIVNVPMLTFPAGGRRLELDCVSVWQRLLDRGIGNWLNGGFHRQAWPGEKGLDNTTGVTRTVAWGVASVRGVVSGGGGGRGNGNGDGIWPVVHA
jgi:hypothetical protein